ncbi:MAG TPA: DUF2834 domain-containing protein [Gemmatimonadales bacterium]|nr:DUF2834 domain-containing protein [Gemmatimonadales bacterium]
MKPKPVYLALALIGTVLPLSQFLPFLRDNGLDAGLFVEQLFATRVSAFFGFDVLVSAVVLWAFMCFEERRVSTRHRWTPVLATVLVGVSLGLPLYLYLRERRLEQPA